MNREEQGEGLIGCASTKGLMGTCFSISRVRNLAATAAVLLVLDVVVCAAHWHSAVAEFGPEAAVLRGSPSAAVVFFTSIEPFRNDRRRHAFELYRQGRVERLLFVGGYRPSRPWIGAVVESEAAAEVIGDKSKVGADSMSYDTVSNLEAVCALRDAYAPGKPVVLVSDPLHLSRIWRMRRIMSCLSDQEIGFSASVTTASLSALFIQCNKDLVAMALQAVVGDALYREAVRYWRFAQI